LIVLRDSATEVRRDFLGLADCSIGIEQTLAEVIKCGTALEDQVVAVADLR
jgi:hypothetical protein